MLYYLFTSAESTEASNTNDKKGTDGDEEDRGGQQETGGDL